MTTGEGNAPSTAPDKDPLAKLFKKETPSSCGLPSTLTGTLDAVAEDDDADDSGSRSATLGS